MELNVKTLYLIGGIVTVASAGAALLTWYHHRNAPGLRAWAVALLLTVLGALILRVRIAQADLALLLAADMVIVTGFAAMWLSLRFANQGRTDIVRLIALAVGISAAFLALFVVLRALGAGRQAASIPFSLLLGLLGLASVSLGLAMSWYADTPVGPSIVVAAAVLFGFTLLRRPDA